jgi:S-adenosylmethionine-diacylglycerol 3-amino-3-carboxypropyl transferase
MMQAKNLDEQRAIFESKIRPLFRKRSVRWITDRRASLFGLGIPPAQYDALCDNGARRMVDVLEERLERLACDFDMKDNYFAWSAFNRGYARNGEGPCPPYLTKENFMAIKARAGRIGVTKDNLIHFLARRPAQSLDRYVLLDAQDWMDDKILNSLWREITRTAAPGARVIFRTAGKETILPGRVDDRVLSQWTYQVERSAELFKQDRSAIYGGFHLYTLNA